MTIDEAVKVLREHNEWRRYDGDLPGPNLISPKTIGVAIDVVCEYVERRLAERVRWKKK